MKTLIIPDIHYKTERVDRIVMYESPDRVVCSGDYFDPKGGRDGVDLAEATALWLRDKIENPKGIQWDFVEGNHDAPYRRGDCIFVSCSGYTHQKSRVINMILKNNHWEHLKRYQTVNQWLITHAGLSKQHLPDHFKTLLFEGKTIPLLDILTWLNKEVYDSEQAAKACQPHWIFMAGKSRGGFAHVGGLNWCDYEDEFKMIDGLHQIIGHSWDRTVRISQNKENICLDTGLNHYGVIVNKAFPVIKEYIKI